MNADFPRILTLLRKERGISQKEAAQALNVSQALLSHYEKGIRECGLDFVVRTADFYGVSCDYLLGRSPERTGTTISVEDIPDDPMGKENTLKGSVLPVLYKKLIINSLHIVFDLLDKINNKSFTTEVSSFLMLAVYRMFRIVYSVNPKNEEAIFTVSKTIASSLSSAEMIIKEANVTALSQGVKIKGMVPLSKQTDDVSLNTERINREYSQMSSSLFNLIQNSENLLK